jgi:thiamine-phosphate pyrophosphorylase
LLPIRYGVASGGGATPFSFAVFLYPIVAADRIISSVMHRSIYRIIDANFNRAREAIRLMEEFCRFALDSEPLTARTKQLRHELAACLSTLDSGRLISSRDTLGDVGAGKTAANQFARADLRDCFTAAAKRLTEALRVLAEMTLTFAPSTAGTIEKLRYDAYTLEKDIAVFSDSAERFRQVRLYIIITSELPADVFSLTHRCIAGGADCIQLRAKTIQDDALFALAVEFVKICKAAGVISIINDRPDIAVAAGAEGVHLGQNDLPVEQARRLQLKPLIIGKSTHSAEQLCLCCRQNPAYVSLGPVFPTPTKPAVSAVGTDYIRQAAGILSHTGISNVAVGGITLDNVEEVLAAGARAVAVCSAVTAAADSTAACRALKEKISRFAG